MPRWEKSAIYAEQGFTLIEAMAALVVFVIGALGITAILMTSLSTSSEGTNLTGGYEVAQNAVGLIRASGSNAMAFNGTEVSSNGIVNIPNSATAIVASSISTWASMVRALPQGSGSIAVNSVEASGTCPCAVTVSVNWTQGGTPETYSIQTQAGY